MTDTDTEPAEGNKFPDELSDCVVCESDQLHVVEIHQYSLGTLTRDIRCESCGTEYTEDFEITNTVITSIPGQ